MIEHIIAVLLFLVVVAEAIYIFKIKKNVKQLLLVLRNIKQGGHQKAFSKSDGILADTCYEVNDIVETCRSEISRLKKSEQSNKQILTSLSHDIRTPLASLLGYLEALNDGVVSENEKPHYLDVAYRKACDLKSYVDMLFEWFKLNSNEQKFKFEFIDINELTREIIIAWIPVFEKNQMSLSADISDDDLQVNIDKMAYNRILNNLLQNAVNHSCATKVSIIIYAKEEYAYIQVSNNGEQIPCDKLPYIFDRLYKCDDARSSKGSGLGLAITKELVLAMHGKISVESEKDKDTIFKIVLPLKNI